ncbi:MAG: hypothetical protein HQL82_16425, partial [Magnetococcales bacterium]|nr:hypothetical protein [Magnetococcales bacterium]
MSDKVSEDLAGILTRGEVLLKRLDILEDLQSAGADEQRSAFLAVTDLGCILVTGDGQTHQGTRFFYDDIESLEELFPRHLKLRTKRHAVHIRLAEKYSEPYLKEELLPDLRRRIENATGFNPGFTLAKIRAQGLLSPATLALAIGGIGSIAALVGGAYWFSASTREPPADTPDATAAAQEKKASGLGDTLGQMAGAVVGGVATAVTENMDPETLTGLIQGVAGSLSDPTAPAAGPALDPAAMLQSLPAQQGAIDPAQFGALPSGPIDHATLAKNLAQAPKSGNMDLRGLGQSLEATLAGGGAAESAQAAAFPGSLPAPTATAPLSLPDLPGSLSAPTATAPLSLPDLPGSLRGSGAIGPEAPLPPSPTGAPPATARLSLPDAPPTTTARIPAAPSPMLPDADLLSGPDATTDAPLPAAATVPQPAAPPTAGDATVGSDSLQAAIPPLTAGNPAAGTDPPQGATPAATLSIPTLAEYRAQY